MQKLCRVSPLKAVVETIEGREVRVLELSVEVQFPDVHPNLQPWPEPPDADLSAAPWHMAG